MLSKEKFAALVLSASTLILLASLSFSLVSKEFHYLVFYLLIPVFIILLAGRKITKFLAPNLKSFLCKEFFIYLVIFLVSVFAASRLPEFQAFYQSFSFAIRANALLFVASALLTLFCWEFFFRSFMLYGLEEKFGKIAILVQAVPFAFMHFGKPFPELIASFFAGILLGHLALRQKSFYGAVLIHFAVYALIGILIMF